MCHSRVLFKLKKRKIKNIACVAGGSGCARETFCGEVPNSLPIFLATCAAFCTRVRDAKFARVPTPAGYAGYKKQRECNNLVFLSFIIQGCTDWNSNPIDVSRIQYSSLISNSTREAALSLRGVLTPALFEGVMSYMVWWLCTAWLITSLFGVLYLKTFEAS